MQVYLVGGAVRDALLGRPVKDRDWVVVGASPEQMQHLGFEAVGKDFPVFLHPQTHEEYALARTERKTALGYHGFQFNTDQNVTLKQDLQRRDLTINAMAQDGEGHIIDPYGGQTDLQDGILRHVSDSFAEDPVRILRVARFAARFDFDIAPETLILMRKMVQSGEVDALVAERIWQELSKALLESHPQRFFETLAACSALIKILPPMANLSLETWHECLYSLEAVASLQQLSLSYAVMCLYLPAPLKPLHQALRVPKDCADAANLLQMTYDVLMNQQLPNAEAILDVFNRCDVWRRPERWQQLWQTCHALAQAHTLPLPLTLWSLALQNCLKLNTAQLVLECQDKRLIPQVIHQARLQAIASVLI